MPRLLGTLHAAEHALIALLPLWAMCDRWDIGGLSTNVHFQTGRPTIFVYDGHAGGVGITERGFDVFDGWVADTARMIARLPVRARLPVLRAVAEVRQPQRAARQERRAGAARRDARHGLVPRFCSACGASIGLRARRRVPACGTQHWLNAKPAGAALVADGGKLLLTRRAIEPWRDMWCAPSGFCDGPEHPADCAVHEALEEAGIRVRIVGYLGHWIDGTSPAARTAPIRSTAPCRTSTPSRWTRPTREPATPRSPRSPGSRRTTSPPSSRHPATARRIYEAWRQALAAGRLDTPSPDALP